MRGFFLSSPPRPDRLWSPPILLCYEYRGRLHRDLKENGWEGVDWIHLDRVRDLWRAFEHGNKPPGYIKCVEFLLALRLLASREGLFSMELTMLSGYLGTTARCILRLRVEETACGYGG